jgi:hypothetical protein
VTSGVTDGENEDIHVSAASATCGTINTTVPTTPVSWNVSAYPTTNLNWTAPAYSGPGQTCTINYTIQDSFGNTVNDSVVATVTEAPLCGNAIVLNGPTFISTALTGSGSTSRALSVSTGSNTSRLLLVSIGGNTNGNNTVGYDTIQFGGQDLTMLENDSTASRASHWVGYLDEAGLDAATSSNLVTTLSGTFSELTIRYVVFDYVNQSAPIPTGGVVPFVKDSYDTGSVSTGNMSFAAEDYVHISFGTNGSGTWALSGTNSANYTRYADGSFANGDVDLKKAATANGPDNITLTPSSNGRIWGAGVTIQSECNNN